MTIYCDVLVVLLCQGTRNTVLHRAAQAGNLEMLNRLVDRGADLRAVNAVS